MGDFVDTPMPSEFNLQGTVPKGGPGTYDGDDCPGFAEFRRTSSPNAVPEKIKDGSLPGGVEGEPDHF